MAAGKTPPGINCFPSPPRSQAVNAKSAKPFDPAYEVPTDCSRFVRLSVLFMHFVR
jgi:hypothetical protein